MHRGPMARARGGESVGFELSLTLRSGEGSEQLGVEPLLSPPPPGFGREGLAPALAGWEPSSAPRAGPSVVLQTRIEASGSSPALGGGSISSSPPPAG